VEHPVTADLLARCTFPSPGSAVTCAVSGGADSLSLMVLAVAAGCEVTAVHVDHGARPGSAGEADVVSAAAQRFGVSFRSEQVEVAPGPNFEARARAARYSVLPTDVLTGHTADDQAETVLLNLLRGSALDGLAGMRPANRPLLHLRRHETATLCEQVGLTPIVDPSNLDPTHRRNRVRHELLPLLDDIAQRDVAAILARQADLIRDAVDHLGAEAALLDPTDARSLAAAPVALARLAVRRWVAEHTDLGHPIDAAAVQRVLDVASGTARAGDVAAGWQVLRTESRLRLERH
jgi:tRNA(Ile)-lysidine synthase